MKSVTKQQVLSIDTHSQSLALDNMWGHITVPGVRKKRIYLPIMLIRVICRGIVAGVIRHDKNGIAQLGVITQLVVHVG